MTDPLTPNMDLLRRTMDEILAHPELHHQGAWAIQKHCGTAYCFAGWACVLSGHEVDWDNDAYGVECLTDGSLIEETARRMLGLDLLTADELFASYNTTTDLKHYVDEIAEHGLIRSAQITDPWVTE